MQGELAMQVPKVKPVTGIKEYRALVLREVPMTVDERTFDVPDKAVDFIRRTAVESLRFTPGVENFGVLLLNTRRRLIGWQIISTGTLDTLLVHPREVFRLAIVQSAAAIILWHNHPSGDTTPSEADCKVTRDLIRAGQIIKIEVLDHLIIATETPVNPDKPWCSLRELGYFYT